MAGTERGSICRGLERRGEQPEPRYLPPTRSQGSRSLFTDFSLLESDVGPGDGSPGIRFAVLQRRRGDRRHEERELREGPPLGGPSKLSADVSTTWRIPRGLRQGSTYFHMFRPCHGHHRSVVRDIDSIVPSRKPIRILLFPWLASWKQRSDVPEELRDQCSSA